MIVPNRDQAIVDIRKLTDYCLSYEHPRGKHKARVFQSALGLTTLDAEELRKALLHAVRSGACVAGRVDDYGSRYVVDFAYARAGKEAILRSTWIIRAGEDTPRLTSCFVL